MAPPLSTLPPVEYHAAGPPPPDARTTVVVPTYNNLPFVRLCVESIRRNSSFPHQVVVHVSDGSDGTRDWVRRQGLDHTWTPVNAGVCFGVNAAASLARTDLLVYLNDDMYVCPGWDEALLAVASGIGHHRWFLSGTMIEPYGSNAAFAIVGHDFGDHPDRFREADLLTALPSLVRPDWSGATAPPNMVPRRLFELVGGYGVEFSPGLGSDPDFSMKLWLAGVRVFIGVGASRAYHFRHKTLPRVRRNDGNKQFALKYGVPIRWFLREVLRMGNPYSGPLPEIRRDAWYWWARAKGLRYRFTPR